MMNDFYKKCSGFPVYFGRDMSVLNVSTLRQHCKKAYLNYIDDLVEIPDTKGFAVKNTLLRFLRQALPSETGIDVPDADMETILKEACDDYCKHPDSYLTKDQIAELGKYVQNVIKGKDFVVARKLAFKPHLDAHEGFTSLVMQSDLFLLTDAGTEVVKVILGQGDPDQEDLWEVMISLLLQHLMYHPETAGHSVIYGAYSPVKVFEGCLRKAELIEPPEVTINRIIGHLLTLEPVCGTCRYVNCEERRKV